MKTVFCGTIIMLIMSSCLQQKKNGQLNNAIGPNVRIDTIIHDVFDDEDPSTIHHGIGGKWELASNKNGSLIEENNKAIFSVGANHATRWLISPDENEFRFNEYDTVVVDITIDSVAIPTPHVKKKYFSFRWDFIITSANTINGKFVHPPRFRGNGGFSCQIGYSEYGSVAKLKTAMGDDQVDMNLGEHEGPGKTDTTYGFFDTYTGDSSLHIRMNLTRDGYNINFSESYQQGKTSIQGTWNKDSVSLDEEWKNGAYLAIVGRVITGTEKVENFPNYGRLSSVTLIGKKELIKTQ